MHPCQRVIVSSFITILLLLLSACNSSSRTSPTAVITKGIPPSVLTEVSATLIANLPPTAIEVIASPPVATSTVPAEEVSTSTASASTTDNLPPTASATKSYTPIPSSTFTPTYTATPTISTPTFTLTPSATVTRRVTPGTHFVVDNINISTNCKDSLWVFFTIFNNGTSTLESLSLSIYDDTAEKTLLIPEENNNPFMPGDDICAPGKQDSLASGIIGFIGASLNSTDLSNHTLSATIKMCNGESLYMPCYQRIVNFIVP